MSTRDKVRQKAVANRAWSHGSLKNYFLLGRMVFCAHCGFALSGSTVRHGVRVYDHNFARRSNALKCKHPVSYINADDLENAVVQRGYYEDQLHRRDH